MRGNNVMGILFAYVHEERVRELTERRVMASVPFGGRYRLVDFPLSNMVNSGINKVGIITEENYQSLMDHLGSGKAWDLSRKREGLYLLPPFGAETKRTDGKIGTLATIMRFLSTSFEEYVLLCDCDTIANIDYKELYDYNTEKNADITVVYQHGMAPETDKNCIYTVDPEGVVRDMLIKRGNQYDCNYGIGMCLLRRDTLMELVADCMSRNLYDFDKDIIQKNIKKMRICGYEFKGTAYAVTSFASYFSANMALMDHKVRDEMFTSARPIYTKVRDDMSARYGLNAMVSNSLIADGCYIDGEVENCVLFRGVKVRKGARLKNCVVMQDSIVGENSRLDYVVADKNVIVDDDRTMIGYETYPVYLAKGSRI